MDTLLQAPQVVAYLLADDGTYPNKEEIAHSRGEGKS
jgi:hypothetical protein